MSRQLHLVAHNIRSAENIGSLLRTCDSLGVKKLWITGYSPTPEHKKVAKTALGAQGSVEWEQVTDVAFVLENLRKQGFTIVGLEVDTCAIDLSDYAPKDKTALLLGNEVEGISPSLLEQCAEIVKISQRGMKESLNVSVAAAIASFWILNK
jgi:23S rRNA (guanosine2251-2'-O)-methyltransferase